VIELREDRASIVEEGTTGIGQLDAAWLAAKQLHVKCLLDRLDQLTQGWLLDAEPSCGPSNVSFLGNRDEISEML
jgi:hypothetical protein